MSEIIKAYNCKWEILDKEYEAVDGKGILCLMKEPMENMAFSKNKDNDYINSDIRKRLSEFTKDLKNQGADFRTVKLNLLADDGTGWDRPKLFVNGAFLLTDEMYREYRRFISEKSSWWWLATAYSFASTGHLRNSRIVDVDGSLLGGNVSYEYCGVVPACVFSYLPQQDEKQKEVDDLKEQIKSIQERLDILENEEQGMSEVSESEIKSMTKEQNYMRGYKDGKSDVLDEIRAEIEQIADEEHKYDQKWAKGLRYAINIIDKYI